MHDDPFIPSYEPGASQKFALNLRARWILVQLQLSDVFKFLWRQEPKDLIVQGLVTCLVGLFLITLVIFLAPFLEWLLLCWAGFMVAMAIAKYLWMLWGERHG